MSFKRVLLKLSGEQLEGQYDGGFDAKRVVWIADEIKKAQGSGTEIVVMIGGGNYVRGAQVEGSGGLQSPTAHNMGMLATLINAIALDDIFNAEGLPARTLTNVKADQVADQFTHRRARNHLQKGRVVIIGGGSGRPFVTTDTASVIMALELQCDVILKATKVDGVYDSDPMKNPDAKKIEKLTLREAVEKPDIRVMDQAALALAEDHGQSIIVFELLKEGNIARAIAGEAVGTTISA
jgi:uridylate kinase